MIPVLKLRWITFAILALGCLLTLAPSITFAADKFTGNWLLFVSADGGTEIPKNQVTAAIKIAKKGAFYEVAMEIPILEEQSEGNEKDFTWEKFLNQSNSNMEKFSIAMTEKMFNGKYLMADDGKSITHLSGTVTFKYNASAKIICAKEMGCFQKGDQGKLIRAFKNKQKAIAETKALADSKKPKEIVSEKFLIKPGEAEREFEINLDRAKRVVVSAMVTNPDITYQYRDNRLKLVLLDDAGYKNWNELEYKHSVFGASGKQTSAVTGPCEDLLNKDDRHFYSDKCILAPGKYHLVFYDAYAGAAAEGTLDYEKTVEVTLKIAVQTPN